VFKQGKSAFSAKQVSGAKAVAGPTEVLALPNLEEKMTELLAHTNTSVRLTRATLLAIIRGVANQEMILDNSEEFAIPAVRILRQKLEDQLIYGIQFEKDGTRYELELWDGEI
jgi:hypothetical protein